MTAGDIILIVDDEPNIRRVLNESLTAEGYRCLEAADAVDALEKLRANAVSLVLLDIKMPGTSGVEVLPKIEAAFPDVSIIMVTATSDAHIAVQCLKKGACEYVTKPFTLGDILSSIGRAMDLRKFMKRGRPA